MFLNTGTTHRIPTSLPDSRSSRSVPTRRNHGVLWSGDRRPPRNESPAGCANRAVRRGSAREGLPNNGGGILLDQGWAIC